MYFELNNKMRISMKHQHDSGFELKEFFLILKSRVVKKITTETYLNFCVLGFCLFFTTMQEEFRDTKGVIRIFKPKKN